MDKTRNIVQAIFPIGKASMDNLIQLVKEKAIKKNCVFLEKGRRNHSEYFLIEGICRSYLLNPEGEEITISFFKAGDVLSPHVIRTHKGYLNVNFESLTDIVVGEMNASAFEKLMVEDLEIREFGNTVLKIELKRKVEKEINMAALSARQRLEIFRSQFPGFENLISHAAIASYLGITNVSLSRLRNG